MQQQKPGGAPPAQFGPPPSDQMAAFPSSSSSAAAAVHLHPPQQPEAASPITTRPPAPENFDELGSAVAGGFPDEEALAAGEEAERGGAAGNRWPRQETLALLKIRSEMDTAFRDATFKGPLWEEVSRKLAELGYKRSSKKCKEKFENVHKYYKRTKEGRAGRQDGKTYRFFTQLEALHSSSAGGIATSQSTATVAPALAAASPTTFTFTTPMAGPPPGRIQPLPISAAAPPLVTPPTRVVPDLSPPGISAAAAAAAAGISFSSNSSTSSSSESEDEEEMDEAGGSRGGRKRKRAGGGSRYRRQMMIFFEGLMKQVLERQEAMQQRFLEAIEKREQERMKREEAWRLQEMTRLSREQELLTQERAMAASRDTAVISYLQKISGQSIPFPAIPVTNASTSVVQPLPLQPPQPPPGPTPQPVNPSTLPLPSALTQQKFETPRHIQASELASPKPVPPAPLPAPISSEPPEGFSSGGFELVSPSRWPKAEVHALIRLRSGLESRYQEPGAKGPLWEEISAGMQRIGYNRSAKRCKEKWENINKYFKKVKESSKKRPEDSKTCPYFHQLDALYRRKLQVGSGSSSSAGAQQQQQQQDAAQEEPQLQSPTDSQGNTGNRNGGSSEGGGGSNTSNGGHPQSFLEEGMKKPVDIVKELMARQQQHQQQEHEQQQHHGVMDDYDKMDEADSDNMLDHDDDDDEDDEDDDDSKLQYKIQFQHQTVSGGGGGSASTTAAATATQAGSFLAMVQ